MATNQIEKQITILRIKTIEGDLALLWKRFKLQFSKVMSSCRILKIGKYWV